MRSNQFAFGLRVSSTSFKMRLIPVLRPFLIGLLLTGLNPMRISRNGTLRVSVWRRLYTLSLALTLLPIMLISFRDVAATLFDRNVQTNMLVQVVQVGLLMADYVMVLVFGQWAPQQKCDFINAMHDETANSGQLLRQVGRRMYAEAVGLNLLQLALTVLLEWLHEHVLVLSLVFVGLVLTVNIEILYMRTLAKVLIGLFRVIRLRLEVTLEIRPDRQCRADSLTVMMDKLERVVALKAQYQAIVGTFLGFHLTVELLAMTLILYVAWYSLVYVGGIATVVCVTVILCARIAPVWLKFMMLVSPFEQLAKEVRFVVVEGCLVFIELLLFLQIDGIRSIAVKAVVTENDEQFGLPVSLTNCCRIVLSNFSTFVFFSSWTCYC